MDSPSQTDLNFAADKWGLSNIKFHRRVANFVYFAQLGSREVVLRLTESAHRSLAEVESELDWIDFLHCNNVKVANPIRNIDGQFVISTIGNSFVCAVFEKATGISLTNREIKPEFARVLGKYLGQMNHLTKKYQPDLKIKPRNHWHNDTVLLLAKESLDPKDTAPYHRMNELIEWLNDLPKSIDCYGLIHGDLHQGNFLIQDNQITTFDFDDSCYHWFVYDLIPPLDSLEKAFHNDNSVSFEEIKDEFLAGYLTRNHLDSIWFKRIDIFKNFRVAIIYHWAKTWLKNDRFDQAGIEWTKVNFPKFKNELAKPIKLL